MPHPSCAPATPVALVRMSAGHSSSRSGGQVRVGGVVSLTITSVVQALRHWLLITVRARLKFSPQLVREVTVTVWALVGPEMAPLPVTDQEYAFIPAGARNWLVERGHTKDAPVIEHTGNGATVKRTSLVSTQPSAWRAVKRRVAVAEKTCAV